MWDYMLFSRREKFFFFLHTAVCVLQKKFFLEFLVRRSPEKTESVFRALLFAGCEGGFLLGAV